MKVITMAGLLLLSFVSLRSAAQPPCPATPVFTVSSEDPVRLTISHATTRSLEGPRVEIAGTFITIWQIDRNLPPPPIPSGFGACNNRTVSLGTLPPRKYAVKWHYAVPPAMPNGPFGSLESFTFSFARVGMVPALGGQALIGLILLLGMLGIVMLRR
ncbi:MAG TPA: hypothetical protein VGQ76_13640 [Thermoanaerobaculia bacterium]|jgi:hypothetical protein|nr:hypothetical protein [Thermoanaerobaculia bacterium]